MSEETTIDRVIAEAVAKLVAEKMMAGLAAALRPQWQPMETAPRDGQWILMIATWKTLEPARSTS